jgi:hypothetical protein
MSLVAQPPMSLRIGDHHLLVVAKGESEEARSWLSDHAQRGFPSRLWKEFQMVVTPCLTRLL